MRSFINVSFGRMCVVPAQTPGPRGSAHVASPAPRTADSVRRARASVDKLDISAFATHFSILSRQDRHGTRVALSLSSITVTHMPSIQKRNWVMEKDRNQEKDRNRQGNQQQGGHQQGGQRPVQQGGQQPDQPNQQPGQGGQQQGGQRSGQQGGGQQGGRDDRGNQQERR